MITQEQELAAAEAFCREHDLPVSGWVCFCSGDPFAWQNDKPLANTVIPGVIAVDLIDHSRWEAVGGDDERGAAWWRRAG